MSSLTSSLSKEKLKNELQAHNVPLPPSSSKKDVYVQLYEKHVVANAGNPTRLSEFSSDEEDSLKHNQTKAQKGVFTSVSSGGENDSLIVDGINISQLSDEELLEKLSEFHVTGPIVATTRSVYERKLARLLKGELEGEITNGSYQDEEYSDNDEVDIQDSPIPIYHTTQSQKTNSPPRKKVPEETPKQFTRSNFREVEDTSAQRGYTRETPTPRRSLRANISYTPADRTLYADLIKRKTETVNNLASRVVENTPEPVQESTKKGISGMTKLSAIMVFILILMLLVYYNMEVSDNQTINALPGNNK